jgi:ribosomal protein L10
VTVANWAYVHETHRADRMEREKDAKIDALADLVVRFLLLKQMPLTRLAKDLYAEAARVPEVRAAMEREHEQRRDL